MQAKSPVRPVSAPDVRRELHEILESQTFRQAPKLSQLLTYVCNKAMQEEADQVTEYTIGVDVFGKPENFKESKDSNVRVEIHRLRKRLAQFYEKEGIDRPIRMVIAPGRYTPEFVLATQQGEEATVAGRPSKFVLYEAPAVIAVSVAPSSDPPPIVEALARRRPGGWVYGLAAAGIGLVILTVFLVRRTHVSDSDAKRPAAAQVHVERGASASPVFALASVPLRLMAGYAGPPHTDGSGFVWGPDQYFQGGRSARRGDTRTARTNNPFIFQYSRIGDFSYTIPLRPGTYELHLYFIESEYGPEFGNGENDRTFFLHINDQRIVPEIDVESETMGPNVADERVFKDVKPGPDGKLRIAFESGKGVPLLNAIEILPGAPHGQIPIRLVTQPAPFTGHDGVKWQPDNYYMNGRTIPRNLGVAGTPDPGLFAAERFGHFTYAIPVDMRGRYTVTLHFAELYFGTTAAGSTALGRRIFSVMCNGVLLLDNFDIFKEAGLGHAVSKSFYHLKPTAQGKLNLTFEPSVNYALVFGIEAIDESE